MLPHSDDINAFKIGLSGSSNISRLRAARRRKPWNRPKDLPEGEVWPPDKGLHPISESWKQEQERGHTD